MRAPAAHTAPPSGELAIDARGLAGNGSATPLAVDGVDLAVPIGSVYGRSDPTAGKTTTVSMLATLLRPDGGEGKVSVTTSRDAVAVRLLVGVTGQYAPVDEDLTASQNLMLFARLLASPAPPHATAPRNC